MKAILATCVRNEGPYLLEWIAYYKLIGFDKIYIYSNDNTDGSTELLNALDQNNLIEHRPRVLAKDESPQLSAYKHLSDELLVNSDYNDSYLCWLDCDEYLALPQHDSIHAFISSFDNPDAIFINWKHFGSGGESKFEDGFTIDRFTKCNSVTDINKKYKVLCKLDSNKITAVNNHRPVIKCKINDFKAIIPTGIKSYIPAPIELLTGEAFKIKSELNLYYNVCQLNHYAVRSLEEYSWKKLRGNGRTPLGSSKLQFKDIYFDKHDLNDETDTWLSTNYSKSISAYIEEFPNKIKLIHDKVIMSYMNLGDGVQTNVEDVISPKHLSIDVDRKLPGFKFVNIALNKCVIASDEEFDCSGIVLHDDSIEDIFLQSSSGDQHNARIGLKSPIQERNYPTISHAKNSRFNFKNKLNLSVGKYVLYVKTTSSTEAIASISVDNYNKEKFVSGSMQLDFYKLATKIKNIIGARTVFYMANPGNWGDGLIRAGAIKFFNDFGIRFTEIKDQDIESIITSDVNYSDSILIYGGGGAWGNTHSGGYNRVRKLHSHFKHTIVLPSTFQKKINSNKITYYSRGLDHSMIMANGNFCHDMAFYIGKIECLNGFGQVNFYRTDNEVSGAIKLPEDNLDISLLGATFAPFEEFFSYIAPYSVINTDRLHVAVAAALLGKRVSLYSNSYFKIDEVFHATFEHYFKNVEMISKGKNHEI